MFFGGGIPFGFGGGDGGGGGGRGGRGGAGGKPVDTESLYAALGVPKDASDADIRKAYRRIALKEHPDKGGDPDKFKAASHAYEVLSDPKKRAIYDEAGEEGVSGGGGGGGGMDAGDLFASLFGGGGGGGGGGRGGGPRKTQNIMHPLQVSLEDLYNGRTVKLAITRDMPCGGCGGAGTADGSAEAECGTCKGRGMVMMVRHMGAMIQQMTSPCPTCHGAGKSTPDASKCRACGGKKTEKEKKVLEVHIEKGMKHGSRIVFRGEAGVVPGAEAGDVIFVVQQKQHPLFKRDGNDLFLDKDIPLVDALCGARFLVTHLDRRRLRVQSAPGEIISPGQFKCVEGAGMPLPNTGGMRHGDLYLRFNVVFPPSGSLDDRTRALLARLLPRVLPRAPAAAAAAAAGSSTEDDTTPPPTPVLDDPRAVDAADDAEDVLMSDVSVESRAARVAAQKEAAGSSAAAYDSDGDDGGGGGGGAQRVQCAQQ